jgi:mycothiol synthase
VLEVIAAAAAADGRASVSQETQLELQRGSSALRHVVATGTEGLVGYGALTTTAGPRAMLAEIAVHPAARRLGHGEALLGALLALAAPQQLSIWAHGSDSAVAGFAAAHDLHADRILLQLRRDVAPEPAADALPQPYRLRTFRPGQDEDALLRANAAAFTALPDQGGWGRQDLADRMAQDWFDPTGCFLAIAPDGAIAGFHWTKQHPPEPLGEIYVLGVTPQHRQRGLARALAGIGLAHLGAAGCRTVLLYVDAANTPARRLYRELGFRQYDTDTLFRG